MDKVPLLLVTANVGSVFEDPKLLLEQWITEFLQHINEVKPKFVALHLQEVGGKTYEKSLEHVARFIKVLCESKQLEDFDRVRIYLDEDFSSAEHFTALGNVYFIHKSIENISIWNFLLHKWESADGKDINTGNIESIATKEKAKFPQHFFPECKWSRKGFLRTRWTIEGTTFDLVNIHLFHDASNFQSMEETPSVYCKSRRKALIHTLERFHRDIDNNIAPYFVFGDFNFRCDTEGVVRQLTEDLTMHRIQNIKNDHTKVQYRNGDGQNVLTVGKKEFTHVEHQTKFKENWLKKFDHELMPLKELLFEYEINFPPSYPYEEDPQMPDSYMFTRCPAWCDRILLSPAAKVLLEENDDDIRTIYGIIGENICMGDHKPVFLNVNIKTNQGTVKCSCDITINNNNYENHHNNQIMHINDNQVIHKILNIRKDPCIKCYETITNVIAKLQELESSHYSSKNNEENLESLRMLKLKERLNVMKLHHHSRSTKPLVSINVTDTDNNLDVCMCAHQFGCSDDDLLSSMRRKFQETNGLGKDVPDLSTGTGSSNKICPICLNIIKQQSNDQRKTLVAKKLMLANDIIVNRIDTHYLNTYTNGGGGNHRPQIQDPYTPESVESHSPLPEVDEKTEFMDEATASDCLTGDGTNEKLGSKINLGGVSPRQLKSRLQLLQSKTSFHPITDSDDEVEKRKSKKCCIIL